MRIFIGLDIPEEVRSRIGEYMESVGLRHGRLAAAAAGDSELIGGALLVPGLATPLAATLLAATMLVAARTDHRGKGFWIYNGGTEYVLTNAVVVLGLAFNGAGRWSLDHAIGWDVAGLWWGAGAAATAVIGAMGTLAWLRASRIRTITSWTRLNACSASTSTARLLPSGQCAIIKAGAGQRSWSGSLV